MVNEEQLTEFLVQSNYIENERSQQAHNDALASWDYLDGEDRLTEEVLLETHRLLLQRLAPSWAGNYRKVDVRVGCRICPQWPEVPTRMDVLLEATPTGEQTIKEWHVRFETVHPFRDGNGRAGRIIMNWQRLNVGLPLLIIHEGEEQQEYYEWFK